MAADIDSFPQIFGLVPSMQLKRPLRASAGRLAMLPDLVDEIGFEHVLNAIASLPDPQRSDVLEGLAIRAVDWPTHVQLSRLDNLLDAIATLDEANRKRALKEIAESSYALSDDVRLEGFNRIMSAIDRLSPSHRIDPLLALERAQKQTDTKLKYQASHRDPEKSR